MRTSNIALASLLILLPSGLFAEGPLLSSGDTAWVLTSAALVFLMTLPALALFYSGMVKRKNIVSTIQYSMSAAIIVSILWVTVMYSLIFGTPASGEGGGWIGGLANAFMEGIGPNSVHANAATIPEYAYSMFQMMFAIITVALISGAVAERMSFKAWVLFIALWSLCVYTPLAFWVWNPAGWLFKAGALDFAGGLVVHTSSGVSALVLVKLLGPRAGFRKEPVSPPSKVGYVFIGTGLLWVGWFGFNGGSAVAANGIAGSAFMVTNTAAAVAALAWMLLEWFTHGKPTLVGACTGAVAGLVVITPASGFTGVLGAVALGALVSVLSFGFMTLLRKRFKYDDALDVFSVHGIGGILGAVGTGVFANGLVYNTTTGALYGNWAQLLVQLESVLAAVAISVVGTLACFFIVKLLVRGKVAATAEQQATGMDQAMHGESIETLV